MGLIWTLTACILGVEIFLIVLFLIPFLSAQRWRKIFKLRLFAFVTDYMLYFVFGLGIIFADSLNKLRKCTNELEHLENSEQFPNADFLQLKRLNLFLAQRNFYISFFSLFLWLVLTRLVKLITSHGQLQIEYEATKKQALSATDAAQKFMNEAHGKKETEEGHDRDRNLAAVAELEAELKEAKKSLEAKTSQLKTSQTDLEAMKSQAEATKREYDRLLNELHPATEGDGGADKKGN